MHSRAIWFVVLAGVAAAVCLAFARTTSAAPFGYDESDYMYAGTQGFAANYLDRGSIGMDTYVAKGFALLRDRTQRQNMSQLTRNSGDVDFYRHYHGPIYAFWLAGWHAFGAHEEAVYRASGLVLHVLGAMVIFFMFPRVFPELPPVAAFVAAGAWLMNRTGLVAATSITQHVAFAFLACCALFAVAEFLRTGRERYWYAAAALMAAAFAVVEIGLVMAGSIVVTVALLEWRQGFRKLLGLFASGAVCFIAALALLWPLGVFKLNALKGYAYLAYIAVARKTFSPISPLELWGFKVRVYPLEFVLLFLAMLMGALWLWRTGSFRAAAPFVVYGVMFFGVTLVVTAPYTYYHASMTMALAVVTGVLVGELWNRGNAAVRSIALAAVLISLVALDVTYYREAARDHSVKPTGTADVLAFLNSHRVGGPLFVPYVMVPPLHYYRPDLATIGYDDAGTGATLESQAAVLDPHTLVFCGATVCRLVGGSQAPSLEQIGTLPPANEPLYAMRLTR